MTVEITKQGESVAVASPYLPAFVEAAKKLGGRWDGPSKTWRFDARDEAEVRAALVRHFGTTGDDSPELVSVHCEIGDELSGQDVVYAYGRKLVWRTDRDSAAKYGDGVRVASGSFPSSGGSRKSPSLSHRGPVVLVVRDVPRPLAEKLVQRYYAQKKADLLEQAAALDKEVAMKNALPAQYSALKAEIPAIEARAASLRSKAHDLKPVDKIVEEAPAIDRATLEAEKARLLARLEQINLQLVLSDMDASK